MIEETFVLVAGGGPAGLTLALDLGQRGVPTILVNEGRATAQHPKCNYVNTRAMEQFRRLGVADDIRAIGHAKDFPRAVAFRSRYCGHEIGRIDLSFLAADNWPGPEFPVHCSQIDIEPVLKAHAEQTPGVSVRFGWRLTALSNTDNGVEATITEAETGEVRTVRARFAVGCDGARSMMRDIIGASMIGEDGTATRNFVSGTMLSYYFRSKDLLSRCGHAPALMTWIVNHDARGYVMAQRGGDRFVAHFAVPEGVDCNALESGDVLARMLGADVDVEILSQGAWTGGLARVADRYSQGNIFIAGDAVHHFTPMGGFGLNTAVGDVANLAWKIAAVHDGWAGPHLMQSYEDERRPIGYRNTRIGITCAKRKDKWIIPADINEDTPEAEAARRKFGAFIEVDDLQEYATIGVQLGERYESAILGADLSRGQPDDPWDRYVPCDIAGARAPHFLLADGASIYDRLGQGFTFLTFGDGDTSNLESAARERNVPLTIIRHEKMPAGYTKTNVLIRSDEHIAWAEDELPVDCGNLIDLVRGN